jgi:hypothetical protein
MSANSNYTDSSPVLSPQLDRISRSQRTDVRSSKNCHFEREIPPSSRWESCLGGEAEGHSQTINQVRITLEAWSPLGPWATSNLTSSP